MLSEGAFALPFLLGVDMAVCVAVSGSNLVVSGTAIGSCTDYALMTASEYSSLAPMISHDDTLLLSGMVVAVWAVAWGIKALRKTL